MKDNKLKVAVVGLGFGGCFVPIWVAHPDVYEVVICDFNKERVADYLELYPGVTKHDTLEDIINDPTIDAVHLLTCIPDHAEHTIAVLNSGKHCACTVPMATSLEDIRRIIETVRKSQKNYMMMETTLYTYQYFYVKQMVENGELGDIQLMRGCHYQDMEHWPDYWAGLPPFWYGTHAIAPLIGLSGSRVERVSCLGSGKMRDELVQNYGNPFPTETAHLKFANGLAAETTRTLFETAHVYKEGLDVYGSKKTFEWGFADRDNPIITSMVDNPAMRGMRTPFETVEMPNYYQDLPEELWKFTVGNDQYDETNPQDSLKKGAGAGHHGSHAHLINEFARSIIEKRKPWIDEVLGANITATGICSHESALRDGEWITVPQF